MRLVYVALVLAGCRPPGYGKPGLPDAGEVADAGPTSDAGADAAAVGCEHAFRLDGYGTATSAWLTGDFVQWAGTPPAGAIALTLGNDAAWTGSHLFAAGTHQYKFIVDVNQWIADPTNPDTIDDGLGGTNSLYSCTP